jgi:hypothetical protein
MCDPSPVRSWLFLLLGALVLAVGAIGAAVISNGSILLAWMSTGWMIAATLLTGGGILLCIAALSALDTFCRCAGSACEGACGNMRRVIQGIQLVLGFQLLACIAVTAIAWIPLAPLPFMITIGAALFFQLVGLVSLIPFYSQLATCQASPSQPI